MNKILGIDQVLKAHQSIKKMNESASLLDFIENTLSHFQIEVDINEEHLDRISSSGPTVVVANHPFGGIEGILIAFLLLHVRSDVKILANPVLEIFKELNDLFYFVEPYQTQQAYRHNIVSTKKAYQWLKNGGVLVVFPAGEVSHATWNNFEVRDPKWNTSIVRMIRKTNANVTPIYFHGKNSFLFQAMGLFHSKLRTLMLPRELLNKKSKKIRIAIGKKISYRKIPFELDDEEIISYLRFRTYMLSKYMSKTKILQSVKKWIGSFKSQKLIAPHKGTYLLLKELNQLPKNQKLEQAKDLSVYWAHADQIPYLLHEIGRLREKTFRQVGEGSGKRIDLDDYDQYYIHLFLWNETRKEMVGAYRIGKVDQIIAEKGTQGLYTRSLFTFDQDFIEKVGPAIELGRSFIRPKYQKEYSSLLLLWKGIAKFISQNPHYRTLFGTVSISNEYNQFSKQLMMDFIEKKVFDPVLSKEVTPLNPPKGKMKLKEMEHSLLYTFLQEIEDLSDVIADYELKYKGVPILLKHYLKLGGKIIGFNVDTQFQNCVDGLVLVDLEKTEEKILKFYMGPEGYAFFQKHHRA